MNPLLPDQDGREAAFEEATRDVFSDTPETDAHQNDMHRYEFDEELALTYQLARKLERERDELSQALSGRTVSCEQCNEAARKIEEMREVIKEVDALLLTIGYLKEDLTRSKLQPFLQ